MHKKKTHQTQTISQYVNSNIVSRNRKWGETLPDSFSEVRYNSDVKTRQVQCKKCNL